MKRRWAIAAAWLVLVAGTVSCGPPRPNHPVIGAKNFTEQVLLGELLVQHIEARTGLKVDRRFYLAGSYICHQALVAGRIDGYVEYTGTALTAILKQPMDKNRARVLETVQRLYRRSCQSMCHRRPERFAAPRPRREGVLPVAPTRCRRRRNR